MQEQAPDPAYPAHREADVVLRDGGTAHLRPITPSDAAALQEFHVAQSPESIYLRFFAPLPRLSDRDLARFTTVDHVERVAFVVTVGGRIIGVGRYDRVAPREAEVAFNISDAHQGRGLGSVLLEHLAAAARENGIHRFVAEVLPQNRKMISVFRDAGYEVGHQYDDGVIHLEFDIDPTERSLAVMEAREHRAEALSMRVLLNPRSVVLVGASRREGTVGHRLLADLIAGGFRGDLHVVHPEAGAVLGVSTVRRLDDLPGPVDLAVIAVPAAAVLDVVAGCARVGVRGLVVVSAGFAETGPQGRERQRELVRMARENGMRVVGPNSWGVSNTADEVRLNVGLSTALPRRGRLGLFCQSGALSVSVLAEAARRGVGVSTFLSAGNRADVSGNDCMQYWEEDPDTAVVGLYLESVGNPRKFSRIARRLSRHTPVVVVKSGGASGVPPGHAVRQSRVPPEAFDAMLEQSGCIRVDDVHHLFDVAQLLLSQPLPAGNRVAVVANTEGLGALLADCCAVRGLVVPRPPVAVATLADAAQFRAALEEAAADDGVDAVVAAFVPPLATGDREVADALAAVAATSSRPVLACLLGMDGTPAAPSGSGADPQVPPPVPVYSTPEEAVRALAAVVAHAAWRRRDPGPRVDPQRDPDGAARVVSRVLVGEGAPSGPGPRPAGTGRVELAERTAAELLACYGLEVWPVLRVGGPQEAVEAADRLGWPVALKTTAAHLRHRVDLGGVQLDIASPDQLREQVERMRRRLAPLGGADLVVQRMAPAGVACVVRSAEDPLFGPVVSLGLAGDASELLGDVAHAIPPVTTRDVAELVRSLRASPRLFGHRGARPVDVAALEDVVARVACLAHELPQVADLELNPVVVTDRGAVVLGARVTVSTDPGRPDTGRRELTATP